MPGSIPALAFLFAQAAKPAPNAGGSSFNPITMIPAILLLFYLMVWRPKQQEDQKRRDLLNALKKNDRVVTISGIFGTVTAINGESERVVLRVDDERGVKMEFTKASIARVIEPPGEKDKEKAAEAAEGAKAR